MQTETVETGWLRKTTTRSEVLYTHHTYISAHAPLHSVF